MLAKEILKKIFEEGLNLLYPPRCPICEKILMRSEGKICGDCRKGLPYIREPICKKCGKPLKRVEQEYCITCEQEHHEFLCGRAIFLYERSFRQSVQRMKFKNHREYLDFYSEEMIREGQKYLKYWKPKTILPIPMNSRKKRERGFDQSYLLAKKISQLSGIPIVPKALVRSRYTLPQKELDAKERRKNLQGAFELKSKEKIQEPVLLIDDIYTTGATLDEACRTLKKSGVTQIYFLVLCAGNGK